MEGAYTRPDGSWWVEFQRQGALRRAEVGGRRSLPSMGGWLAGWLAGHDVAPGLGPTRESSWQRPMKGRPGEIVIDPQR